MTKQKETFTLREGDCYTVKYQHPSAGSESTFEGKLVRFETRDDGDESRLTYLTLRADGDGLRCDGWRRVHFGWITRILMGNRFLEFVTRYLGGKLAEECKRRVIYESPQ